MARRKLSLKTRRQIAAGARARRNAAIDRHDHRRLDPRPACHAAVRRSPLDAAGACLCATGRALRRADPFLGEFRTGARPARLYPDHARDRPGTFKRKGDRVDVYVRAFRFSDEVQPARQLRVGFDDETIATLVDVKGTDVPVYRLDPLLIGSIFPIHGEDRIVVAPAEVPKLLPLALKAVEDRKFDTHHGVNPLAILRALSVNVRAGQVEQGGSTLTQQLVKSYFLDSRRTLRRKIEEAMMAVILESRFEKADIMNAYINEIYLGQDGRRAVHGFGLASQFYFGKPVWN